MPELEVIQAENRNLARQINLEARSNPQSPYAGKYVGIANGKVVIVAESCSEVFYRLHEIESDPRKTFAILASHDYSKTETILSATACRA